jgi:hypothetical protein
MEDQRGRTRPDGKDPGLALRSAGHGVGGRGLRACTAMPLASKVGASARDGGPRRLSGSGSLPSRSQASSCLSSPAPIGGAARSGGAPRERMGELAAGHGDGGQRANCVTMSEPRHASGAAATVPARSVKAVGPCLREEGKAASACRLVVKAVPLAPLPPGEGRPGAGTWRASCAPLEAEIPATGRGVPSAPPPGPPGQQSGARRRW